MVFRTGQGGFFSRFRSESQPLPKRVSKIGPSRKRKSSATSKSAGERAISASFVRERNRRLNLSGLTDAQVIAREKNVLDAQLDNLKFGIQKCNERNGNCSFLERKFRKAQARRNRL